MAQQVSQKVEPSGGCGSFLFCSKAMYLEWVSFIFDVELESNKPSQLDQDSFHGILSLPLYQTWQFRWVNFSSSRIDTRQVYAGNEGKGRWFVRVIIAAMDGEGIDSIFMCALYERMPVNDRTCESTLPWNDVREEDQELYRSILTLSYHRHQPTRRSKPLNWAPVSLNS